MRTLFGALRTRESSPKEFALQVSVADILNRWAVHGWRWTHIPMGESRGDPERARITGARLKRMGTKRGWPDFILCSPAAPADKYRDGLVQELDPVVLPGQAHFLELKRKGEQLSDDQRELSVWMQANGFPYEVADDFKTALAILKHWGAVRARVSA